MKKVILNGNSWKNNSLIQYLVGIKLVQNILIRILRIDIRRKRQIGKYLKNNTEHKLQIGCGGNRIAGWLNTGISIRECWSGVYMDAGKPFPLPDASFDFVFSEHLFEHLTYKQAKNMLQESCRILKPGGVFRVATPDLQFLLGLYQEPENLSTRSISSILQ